MKKNDESFNNNFSRKKFKRKLKNIFKKLELKYPRIFNPQFNKPFIVVCFCMILCIFFTASYATFVYLTSSYRASDIRLASLNYELKIEGSSNNCVTVYSKETKVVNVEVTSLNGINSKFELYYNDLNNKKVDIFVDRTSTNESKGQLGSNAKTNIKVKIVNNESSNISVCLGVKGGYENNELALSADQFPLLEDVTKAACFYVQAYDNSLTGYFDYEGGNSSNPPCPRDVVIPKEINGVEIKTISGAFNNKQITSVIIPDSVTSIVSSAFKYNKLKTVELPKNLETLGTSVFDGNELTSIVIPNKVTQIDYGAFFENQLTQVTLSNSLISVEEDAFRDNQITTVTFPSTLKTIGRAAFSGNQLTNLALPDSVVTIGREAFQYNLLTDITLSSSLTTIDHYAFRKNMLTTVRIPNKVTTIGIQAFHKTSSSNPDLTTIINTTGRSFNWGDVINENSGYNFVTGTVQGNPQGKITVTAS